ncbi:MAG: citrate/2-methylcitrate synthase [Spirochaetaceae bacterium]|nr:citrate/2-methylcitrate synthase [Spirochaetaceae bacterium]
MSTGFIERMKNKILSTKIDPSLYPKYNVKRGLRNSDESGVLVGLTEIGDVHGYIFDEGEMQPDEGRLLYRGVNITELVKGIIADNRHGFEETTYFLLFGELPSKSELDEFNTLLDSHRTLPRGFAEDMIMRAPSHDIMNKLARSVLVSYSYDKNADDIGIDNVLRQCIELIAKLPTMAAYGYQAKAHYHDGESLHIHSPKTGIGTAENLLHLIRSDSKYTKLEAQVLDLALVLHAEHGGGNNSTFTNHVVTSTNTDTYAAIAAALCSMKGPRHGGANKKALNMMENIMENVKDWQDEDEIGNYLRKILNKEAFDKAGFIYGYGHAVYTLSDPRAVLLKEKASDLAIEKGLEDEFNLFTKVEKLAPQVISQEKHSEKRVSANVDFYSGFVYKMLNIPIALYTPIFAISRVAGWSAHRIEELISGGRIIRPAYKNVAPRKKYIPLADR